MTQCLRCDRGQRRKCVRLPSCTARVRSPNGTNLRKIGARRAARGESAARAGCTQHAPGLEPRSHSSRARLTAPLSVPSASVVCTERAQRRAVRCRPPPSPLVERPETPPPEPEPEPKWTTVAGIFLARASDGVGHHDGALEYVVTVKMEEFGGKFVAGGRARFTQVSGGDAREFALPAEPPPPGHGVAFRLPVHPQGAGGRCVVVGGLEVRAA